MKLDLKKTALKGALAALAAVGTALVSGIAAPVVLLKLALGTFLTASSQNVLKHGKRRAAVEPGA